MIFYGDFTDGALKILPFNDIFTAENISLVLLIKAVGGSGMLDGAGWQTRTPGTRTLGSTGHRRSDSGGSTGHRRSDSGGSTEHQVLDSVGFRLRWLIETGRHGFAGSGY